MLRLKPEKRYCYGSEQHSKTGFLCRKKSKSVPLSSKLLFLNKKANLKFKISLKLKRFRPIRQKFSLIAQ